MSGAPARLVAPSSSATWVASHSRRWVLPPRGWSPGSTGAQQDPRGQRRPAPSGPAGSRRGHRARPAAIRARPGSQASPSRPPRSRQASPTQNSHRGAARQRTSTVADDLPGLGLERGRPHAASRSARPVALGHRVEVGRPASPGWGARRGRRRRPRDSGRAAGRPSGRRSGCRRRGRRSRRPDCRRRRRGRRATARRPRSRRRRSRPAVGSTVRGQRPRQGVAVDLAGGAGRQRVDHGEARHERGGQLGAQGGEGTPAWSKVSSTAT